MSRPGRFDSAAPTWLIEGFADYVAYAAYPATESAALTPLRTRVRGGWLPGALPSEADFRASAAELDLAYAQVLVTVPLPG